MAERCDICGVTALENQEFAVEHLPLRRARRYCPACQKRFYERVILVFVGLLGVLALAGVVQVRVGRTPLLDSYLWPVLLCFVQWCTILPHELGHALAAWLAGYRRLRILIGSGRALLTFEVFGVPVLVNWIPLGGITLIDAPAQPSRWRILAVIAAGPLVNLGIAALVWPFIGTAALWDNVGSVPKLVFWANLLVLVENLVPHFVPTPLGRLPTDGLLLWTLLFRWNRPRSPGLERVPAWQVALCRLLKGAVLLMTSTATVCFAAVLVLSFLWPRERIPLPQGLLLAVVMIGLTLLAGWATVRVAREPIARFRKPLTGADITGETIGWSPRQLEWLGQVAACVAAREYGRAEALLDQVVAAAGPDDAAVRRTAVLLKLGYIVEQQDINRAEQACLDYVRQEETTEAKWKLLDGFVCSLLYQSPPLFLPTAERLARLALELAPGTLTLKGTLGSVWAEQGNLVEAEPLLQECLARSPSLHDQGISSCYLGLARLRAGKLAEAGRLLERSMLLWPHPWLVAKARGTLKELEERRRAGP